MIETNFERYCACLGKYTSRTHILEAEQDMQKAWEHLHGGPNCRDIDKQTWEQLSWERDNIPLGV